MNNKDDKRTVRQVFYKSIYNMMPFTCNAIGVDIFK